MLLDDCVHAAVDDDEDKVERADADAVTGGGMGLAVDADRIRRNGPVLCSWQM